MVSLYLNPIASHKQAIRPLPKPLLAALLLSAFLHFVLLAFRFSASPLAPAETPLLTVKIELVKPVEQPREAPAQTIPEPMEREAVEVAPAAAPMAPATPAPAATVRPRDWQTAARAAVAAFVVTEENSFSPHPAEGEAFAPSRVERADISALASQFKPLPGPRRICGQIVVFTLGDFDIGIPAAYTCAPSEKAPGEIRDDAPEIPY